MKRPLGHKFLSASKVVRDGNETKTRPCPKVRRGPMGSKERGPRGPLFGFFLRRLGVQRLIFTLRNTSKKFRSSGPVFFKAAAMIHPHKIGKRTHSSEIYLLQHTNERVTPARREEVPGARESPKGWLGIRTKERPEEGAGWADDGQKDAVHCIGTK